MADWIGRKFIAVPVLTRRDRHPGSALKIRLDFEHGKDKLQIPAWLVSSSGDDIRIGHLSTFFRMTGLKERKLT